MLRRLLFVPVALIPLSANAEDTFMSAQDAIEQYGGVSISDRSTYFTFSADGSFASGPLGMSGRTMRGCWTEDADGRLVAMVELGWVNGLSRPDQFRRIVFFISHVIKGTKPVKPNIGTTAELFESYFFIDEIEVIPKPPCVLVE